MNVEIDIGQRLHIAIAFTYLLDCDGWQHSGKSIDGLRFVEPGRGQCETAFGSAKRMLGLTKSE